jgi:hypothetical protein
LEESIPQGLKPLESVGGERAKPEGLAYLDANAKTTAKAKADPYGKTNKR